MRGDTVETVAVADFGKTHLKLFVIDPGGAILERVVAPTPVRPGPPYLHLDAEAAWEWLLGALGRAGERHRLGAIVPTGCGSTAGLARCSPRPTRAG
jgi:sugar (pentulose or hexulose) kinase